ncbi:hypothetical protein PP178_14210 [Zeaxanthinibacter sp. PT1]|uniref:hypothetical protein n=1 Tax=Zeaxanthinibacter TaxID=561554 RepID=UPI00234AA381|nr:hypothetical protein [Zeaxanthinibacter sp. PT1]MDC6352711.1 hypothetical protein [Zeaxanthinibacter sp. PT1]
MKEIKRFHLPPPDSTVAIQYVPEAIYYALDEHQIYKTFPVYIREKEPKGYLDSLRNLDPEEINFANLDSEEDWIAAGKAVFNWPVDQRPVNPRGQFLDSSVIAITGVETTPEGIVPYTQYTKTPEGLRQGGQSCASCHTSIIDGKVYDGVQGDFPFDRLFGYIRERFEIPYNEAGVKSLTLVPWLPERVNWSLDSESQLEFLKAVPPGVMVRQGFAYNYPLSIPSLIGIKDIKYLDHTGLMRHENIGDLMRYAAFNQGLDMLTSYNGYIPMRDFNSHGEITADKPWTHPFGNINKRYSDAQLFALAKYIYSLKAPENPNTFTEELLQTGEMVFNREGCVTCHPPPYYTNNQLLPATGYDPTLKDLATYDIFNISAETDSVSTLYTRRGTGFYKVPSLRGAWMREAFFHNGNLASLEDVLDPKRLEPGYVPTGFKPATVETMAVKGHPFGMEITAEEKEALLAYLRSL